MRIVVSSFVTQVDIYSYSYHTVTVTFTAEGLALALVFELDDDDVDDALMEEESSGIRGFNDRCMIMKYVYTHATSI